MGKRELLKLLKSGFIRLMPKAFYKLHSEFLHLSLCLYVAGEDGRGCLNSIFKVWPDKISYKGRKLLG